MARSADRRPRASGGRLIAGGAAAALGAVALSGCATTQQKAAQLQLNSARIRASQAPTRVRRAGHAVAVQTVAVISAGHRARFVVAIRNPGGRAVSDLPISIGYRSSGGTRVYLNTSASAGYFAAHLAAVKGHGTLSWVSNPTRRLPHGARPFALVGARPSVPGGLGAPLPSIAASVRSHDATRIRVRLHNDSGVPQYQLPVYAVARRHGRPVAAVAASVAELSGGATRTLSLRLAGGRAGANPTLAVQAPATIVQ